MPTSPYIHHYKDVGEQGLIQSITAETIFLGGRDVIYLPREDYNREDPIFGQATQLIFKSSMNVAMMLESTEGFEGEGEFYSKFGLDIKDRVTLSCSRKTWDDMEIESASPVQTWNTEDSDGYDRLLFEPESGSTIDRLVNEDDSGDKFYLEDDSQYGSRHRRPMEGDLIYFPYNEKCFQITFVEHESPMYPGGTLPQFVLTCDLLEYSNEIFITGIPEIDSIEDNLSQMLVESTCITIEGGAVGTFQRGEIIRETTALGTDDSNTDSASARVLSHDSNTGKLVIAPMTPGLATGDHIYGQTSGAYTTFTYLLANDGLGTAPSVELEELADNADESAMNVEVEDYANNFIDFSENDPFSEGQF